MVTIDDQVGNFHQLYSIIVKKKSVCVWVLHLVDWGVCLVDFQNPDNVRKFEISEDRFWKDGQPFQIIGGDLHYFRILPEVFFLHWSDWVFTLLNIYNISWIHQVERACWGTSKLFHYKIQFHALVEKKDRPFLVKSWMYWCGYVAVLGR